MKELPPTLNETYLRILKRIPRDKAPLVQLVLHFIAFAKPQITMEQLREVLSVPKTGGSLTNSGRIHETAIQRLCNSLVRKSNNGLYFEFAHFSVQEFLGNADLLKDQFEPFLISESRSNRLMAIQCLNYLRLENFNHSPTATINEMKFIEERDKNYPLYEYAASQWLGYARDHWDDEEIIHSAEAFFAYEKTAAFTSWSVWLVLRYFSDQNISLYSENSLETISILIHEDFTPLHMACLLSLPKVCKRLLKTGADIEQEGPLGTPIQCAVGMMTLFEPHWIIYGTVVSSFSLFQKGKLAEDPKKTVECLLEARAQLQPTLMNYAMTVFEYSGDIGLATFLLSKGVPVVEDHLKVFSHAFEGPLTEGFKPDFIQSLNSTNFKLFIETLNSMIGNSHLHRELCSLAWKFVVSLGWGKTLDRFVDPSISLTPDAQKHQLLAAVTRGDKDAFMAAAKYSPFRPSDIMEDGKRLLHIALEYVNSSGQLLDRTSIIKALIEAGCSFSQSDSEGCLPVHYWSSRLGMESYGYTWPVQVFIDHGMTVDSQDSKGQNLLHTSIHHEDLLLSFLEHDNEVNAIAALSMTDNEGYTPLSKALNEQCAVSASILFKRGGDNPETWQSPLSPLLLAVRANDEELFKGLLAAGVASPAIDGETLTPLHYIGAEASIGFVDYLKVLYPGACEARVHGKIPLDLYINQLFVGENHHSNIGILATLYPFGPHSHEGGLVWEHFANETLPAAYRRRRYLTMKVCTKVIKELMRLGCLTSYESAFQKPSLLLLLEQLHIVSGDFDDTGFLDSDDTYSVDSDGTNSQESVDTDSLDPEDIYRQDLDEFWPLTCKTFCDILDGTCLWLGFQTDSMAIRLLKTAVYSNEAGLMRLLLEKGVPAHQWVQDQSALEVGCQSRVKIDTFQYLLEFARKEHLDATNPAKDGLGLIHLLAQAKANANNKIAALLQRGADPNLRVGKGENTPALVYHLDHCQNGTALTLLELGADPTLTDRNNVDGCLMAACSGIPTFLSKVMEIKTPSWQVDWERRCTISLNLGREIIPLSGANALHLASYSGNIQCLEFYINHNLLSDVNIASDQMFTPLHCAASRGHANVIKYLHGLGANINARAAEPGFLPLHLAMLNTQLSAVETLLNLGSHVTMDKWGRSLYIYARQSGNQRIIDFFRNKESQHGIQDTNPSPNDFAVASLQQKRGLAIALQTAITGGNESLCKELLERGCPLNIHLPNCNGCSPLLLAIESRKPDIIRWLLNNGASTLKPNYQLNALRAPIHHILGRKDLIQVFPMFLGKYMDDGGSLLREPLNPASTAIANDNTEGMRILFGHLKRNARHYA